MIVNSRRRASIDGGVRKHLRRSPRQRLQQLIWERRIGGVGPHTFIEPGAEYLRHPAAIRLGDHVIVKSGARLCPTNEQASISVGDWTTIGYHTHVFATTRIDIGADCLIAPFCYLVDANHGIRRGRLIREQPMSAAPIVLGDDVWLGVGATVLAGVTIGTGAVVSAGSVVSNDVAAYSIVAGVPAVAVGERRR